MERDRVLHLAVFHLWHGILIFSQAAVQIQAERTFDGRFQHDPFGKGDIALFA